MQGHYIFTSNKFNLYENIIWIDNQGCPFSGVIRAVDLEPSSGKWYYECSFTDRSYLGNIPEESLILHREWIVQFELNDIKCECGAHKIKDAGHAQWCEMFKS